MTITELLSQPDELGAAARQFVETAAKFAELASKNDVVLAELVAAGNKDEDVFMRPKSYKPITRDEIVLAGQQMGKNLAGESVADGIKFALKVLFVFGGI